MGFKVCICICKLTIGYNLVCQFSLPVDSVIFGFLKTVSDLLLPAKTSVHDKWLPAEST